MGGENRSRASTAAAALSQGDVSSGIAALRSLQADIYASIPGRQRPSRGITWVLQQISNLLAGECSDRRDMHSLAECIHFGLAPEDKLLGIPIFLMAEVGKVETAEVLEFFAQAADSGSWVVREFAAAGFRKCTRPGRETVFPWLRQMVQSPNPNLRRFMGETLRPAAENRWLLKEPETSLKVGWP